jgi:hypothetical protein
MATATGFQTFVNNELPIGVAGDFAGANIRASVPSPPPGFTAAPSGVIVGAFAWGNPATGIASNYYQANSGLGFVHRENNALITSFLGFATMEVLPGQMVTLMNQGDYLGLFTGGATVGQKVYSDPYTGLLTANATGNGVTANSTAASLANTGVLTVGATLTGNLAVGQAVYATGIPAGSYISSQISGSAGSTGTYQLSNAVPIASGSWPVVSSTTVYFQGVYETPFYCASNVAVNAVGTGSSIAAGSLLTIGSLSSGTFAAGQFISGGTGSNTIPGNIQILSQVSGTTGGAGVYLTNAPSTLVITSTTVTGTAGQLGKISSWGA